MIRHPVTVQCMECGGCSELAERLAFPPNRIKLLLPDGWLSLGNRDPVPTLYCSEGCSKAADAKARLKRADLDERREPIRRPAPGGLDISDLAPSPMLSRTLEYDVVDAECLAEYRRITGTTPKE